MKAPFSLLEPGKILGSILILMTHKTSGEAKCEKANFFDLDEVLEQGHENGEKDLSNNTAPLYDHEIVPGKQGFSMGSSKVLLQLFLSINQQRSP